MKIDAQVKVWKTYSLFMTMRPPTKVKLSVFLTRRKGYSAWAPSLFSRPKSIWFVSISIAKENDRR